MPSGPARFSQANRRLFDALEAAFPVCFRVWGRHDGACDGLIVVGQDSVPGRPEDAPDVPVLALADGGPPDAPDEHVRLADHVAVDRRLGAPTGDWGLRHRDGRGDGEEVIASGSSGPILDGDRRPTAHAPRARALPRLGSGDVLRDALLQERAFPLVAVMHFLRELPGEGWRTPPLRAAILFDDPNLRRPRYGYIDYDALAAHADTHGYHATMAMIPLDARLPHGGAVATFRARADRLSLAIHGNDHLKRELIQPPDLPHALALAAQAVRRVAQFERRTPAERGSHHGPAAWPLFARVADALGVLGYDALCAIHPYPWTERAPRDDLLAGWGPRPSWPDVPCSRAFP